MEHSLSFTLLLDICAAVALVSFTVVVASIAGIFAYGLWCLVSGND